MKVTETETGPNLPRSALRSCDRGPAAIAVGQCIGYAEVSSWLEGVVAAPCQIAPRGLIYCEDCRGSRRA